MQSYDFFSGPHWKMLKFSMDVGSLEMLEKRNLNYLNMI